MKNKYQQIKKADTANGEGIRVAIWLSGCSFACEGCFNHGAWSYSSGQDFTTDTVAEVLAAAKDDSIAGLSILGGEPLEPRNTVMTLALVQSFKTVYPEKDIWIWTGYTMHELTQRIHHGDNQLLPILDGADVIIDGKYEQNNPTEALWRGSDNQVLWRKQPLWVGDYSWYPDRTVRKQFEAIPITNID